MRRFTFIASSMRKVLTHLVFLWRRICSTITGQRRIAGSSGEEEEEEGKQFSDRKCEPFFPLKSLRWSAVVIAV